MVPTSNPLRFVIDKAISDGVEIQVQLKDQPQPLGPGRVEKVEVDGAADLAAGLYRIVVIAMMGNNGRPPQAVKLPIVFSVENVQFVIEAPLGAADEPLIHTPGARRGGLHIPG